MLLSISDHGHRPFLSFQATPLVFYPYAAWVTDRVFEAPRDMFMELENHLYEIYQHAGWKIARDNKVVFGLNYEGRTWHLGFYDRHFTLGLGVRGDALIKGDYGG
jgi:hypothetical protein